MKDIHRAGIVEEYFDRNCRQYVIPVYQRNYEWEQKECIKLFDDIVLAAQRRKDHFCGSVVCSHLQTEESQVESFVVIDGQQRLTTIYLLLIALRDKLESDHTLSILEKTLVNTSRHRNIPLDKTSKLKLKPVKGDNDQLLLLVDGKFDEIDKSCGIWNNYDLFCRLIDSRREKFRHEDRDILEEISEGLDYLTCAKIELDSDDNAQEIFERINSTGVPLSLSDKIRNFVLMTDANQDELYEKYWLKLEEHIHQENLKFFFSDYLNFKVEGFPKEDEAYDSFKYVFENGHYSNESMLKELSRYAEYYHVFLYGSPQYSEKINRVLDSLRKLKQTTLFVFLFHLFDDFKNGVIQQAEMEKVLVFLLNYSIRRIVCEVGSNSLRGLYKTLYSRVYSSLDNKQHYYDAIVSFFQQLTSKDALPSDKAFQDALEENNLYRKNALCKFLLTSIENQGREQINTDVLTIEHIMPQDKNKPLSVAWQQMLGENWQKDHEKYLHTLGNLTLTGYNSELGDRPYNEKKQKLEEFRPKAVILYEDVFCNEIWNAEVIRKRAKRLSSMILNLFPIDAPETKIQFSSPGYMEYSCDTPDSATSKTPNYYELRGERVACTEWATMLQYVIERLYDFNKNIIEQMARSNERMEGCDYPLFSYDRDKVFNPIAIEGTSIYRCRGFSAERIIRIIRWLLDKYDIEHDDFVYSAKPLDLH